MHCDGTEATGRFRHGDEHDAWTVRDRYGRTGDRSYAHGRKDGRWTNRYRDVSRVYEGYRGLLDGVWTLSDANAAAVERKCWVNGQKIGVVRLFARIPAHLPAE